MNVRASGHDEAVISRPYPTVDDAIRAIQGLKGVGIEHTHIRVSSRDERSAATVAETTGAGVETWVDTPAGIGGAVIVTVAAGEDSDLARRVMHDGLVDGGSDHGARYAHALLDSSVGSGAAVATSSGTATGVSPGGGYEPNTGSSEMTTGGTLGQFAPGADTPDTDDDFPQ